MNAQLKPITARPKTDALRHYLALEAECRNASPLAVSNQLRLPHEDAGAAGGAAELLTVLREIAHTQAIEAALKTFDPPSIEDGEKWAQQESKGMGPYGGI